MPNEITLKKKNKVLILLYFKTFKSELKRRLKQEEKAKAKEEKQKAAGDANPAAAAKEKVSQEAEEELIDPNVGPSTASTYFS